jgi:hypothetical protein
MQRLDQIARSIRYGFPDIARLAKSARETNAALLAESILLGQIIAEAQDLLARSGEPDLEAWLRRSCRVTDTATATACLDAVDNPAKTFRSLGIYEAITPPEAF